MSKKTSDGENHCTALPHQIAKAKLSVCCLQEVHCQWLLPVNKSVELKSQLYWSGHATQRQHRVGIAIKVDKGIEIEEIIPKSAWIIVANVLLIWVV